LLEDERSEERSAVRATLVEGALTTGHVARIAEFGVFVDLGAGVTGLVHLTELSHARVAKPSDVVKLGDYVSVKVLKIDTTTGKISLSMKQAQADPWAGVAESIHVGDRCTAPVKRQVDFGAFVEIRPGLEALVPARELPATPAGWRRDLAPGEPREWVVIGVDAERRRLTVLPAEIAGSSNPPDSIVAGAHLKGRVQKVETFGVFVWLAPGKVGLIPKVWTGVPYGQPFEPKFPEGSEVAVEVVEVVEDGKRIRLAADGVARKEQDEPRRPARGPRPDREAGPRRSETRESTPEGTQDSGSFGTHLGDALKAAFQRRGPDES
jgi:small subunit ribosomal protein S1